MEESRFWASGFALHPSCGSFRIDVAAKEVDAAQFPFDAFLELEWIECGFEFLKSGDLLGIDFRASLEALKRCQRFFVDTLLATPLHLGPQVFHRGTKEVSKLAPFLRIKLVEHLRLRRIVESVLAD